MIQLSYIKALLLLLLGLFLCNTATTQTRYQDSLQMRQAIKIAENKDAYSKQERLLFIAQAEFIAQHHQYKRTYYYILGTKGDIYTEQKQYQQAIDAYKKAITWKEKNKLSLPKKHYTRLHCALSANLQELYLEQEEEGRSQKLLEEALVHAKIAVWLDNKPYSSWLLLGNAQVHLGKHKMSDQQQWQQQDRVTYGEEILAHYQAGIEAYQQLHDRQPNHQDYEHNMGVSYEYKGRLLGQHLGRLEEAITALEISLKYRPNNAETYRLLAVAHGIKGTQLMASDKREEGLAQHQITIDYLKKGLAIKEDSVPLWYNLMVAYQLTNQLDKAIEAREKWKAIDPDYNPVDN